METRIAARRPADEAALEGPAVLSCRDVNIFYGSFRAVSDVTLDFPHQQITALIGPSGCGKSTLLRSLNRMNDLVPGARVEGEVSYHGQDIYDPSIDAIEVRRRIGMVFQKPNPFPKSIYENVAYGLRVRGVGKKSALDDKVEESLRGAALWEEVRNRLTEPGSNLSGGQQQRLCIARALATDPEIILFDEPTSALDPIATASIEELIGELKKKVTILIVTHNMQQAARVSDYTAYMYIGELMEFDQTDTIFFKPKRKETEDYITGRFG